MALIRCNKQVSDSVAGGTVVKLVGAASRTISSYTSGTAFSDEGTHIYYVIKPRTSNTGVTLNVNGSCNYSFAPVKNNQLVNDEGTTAQTSVNKTFTAGNYDLIVIEVFSTSSRTVSVTVTDN